MYLVLYNLPIIKLEQFQQSLHYIQWIKVEITHIPTLASPEYMDKKHQEVQISVPILASLTLPYLVYSLMENTARPVDGK